MSATNRGGERNESDFYPTPTWPVHRLLERYALPGGIWIEPGAGEGHIIRAVNEVRSDVQWTAIEMRRECQPMLLAAGAETICTGNFMGATLEWLTLRERAMVAAGNPPFRWAMEFVHQARALAQWTAFLLRLDFLAGGERNVFMREHTPDVCVIPDRISFTGDGNGDSTEHAWMIWPPRRRRAPRLIVLDSTPLSVRKAQLIRPPEAIVEQPRLFS